VRLEALDHIKTSNDIIVNRTHDLPACSIVPQPTSLPRALLNAVVRWLSVLLRIREVLEQNLGRDTGYLS
jgi:hypothetical protein